MRRILLAAVAFCPALLGHVSARAQKPDTPAVAEWKARIPEIHKTLEESNEELCHGAPSPTIVDAFGLRSDPLSVALVDYCSSGAYTDSMIPMILDHGMPVQARIRGADGKNVQNEFASGASAMHSRSVRLVAEKKAIYDASSDNDGQGRIAQCEIKAYVWNEKTRTFDLSVPLSRSAGAEYCRRMRAKR